MYHSLLYSLRLCDVDREWYKWWKVNTWSHEGKVVGWTDRGKYSLILLGFLLNKKKNYIEKVNSSISLLKLVCLSIVILEFFTWSQWSPHKEFVILYVSHVGCSFQSLTFVLYNSSSNAYHQRLKHSRKLK